MDRQSIGLLLQTITVNYPSFQRNVDPEAVITEWERVLGLLEYDEAMQRLDEYLIDPDHTKPPRPHDLLKSRPRQGSPEYFTPKTTHKWHLEFKGWDKERKHGGLFDEEGREFVHDPAYEDGYHYNRMGQICTIDGRVFA